MTGGRGEKTTSMIPWLQILLLDDIEDTMIVISAKKVLKFTGWRKEERIDQCYQDQATQSWQQRLSVLQSLDQQHLDHPVDNRVSIQVVIPTIQRCLLPDVLNRRMGFETAY
jgi:hypothetical protein